MALFRDEKEALRRLEEALLEEQEEETEESDPEDEDFEDFEEDEEFEEDDGKAEEYEEEENYVTFSGNPNRIRIRNTDRTDVSPEEMSKAVRKRSPGCWVIPVLLAITAVFCWLIWWVLTYMR